MKTKGFVLFALLSISVFGCTKNDNSVKKQNEIITYKPTLKNEIVKDDTSYHISKDEVYVYNTPNGEKIKNQKLSSLLNETHYIQVDTSCTVIVIERKGDWVKIHTLSPDWLQNTHNGWILAKYLDNFSEIKITENDYRIFKEEDTTVKNIYILYLAQDFSKKKAIALNEYIRNMKGPKGNIYVFDSENAANLIDNNALDKDNYIFLADHFISMSTFDAPKSVIYYPYQDNQYKALGGTNLKN